MDNSRKLQLIISKLKSIAPYKRIGLLEYGALQELIKTTQDLLKIVEQYQSAQANTPKQYRYSDADLLRAANASADGTIAELFLDPRWNIYENASRENAIAQEMLEAERLSQDTERLRRETEALRRNRR
jgi:hypothetical protein